MKIKEIESGLHILFDEMGITLPDWRVKIAGREIIRKSDWVWLYVDIYKKYAHKSCQRRKIAFNLVRNIVDWERSIFYLP
jgi:hypothetical protein